MDEQIFGQSLDYNCGCDGPRPFPQAALDIIDKHRGSFTTHPGSGGCYSGPTDIRFDHRLPPEDAMKMTHAGFMTNNLYEFKGWIRTNLNMPAMVEGEDGKWSHDGKGVCVSVNDTMCINPSGDICRDEDGNMSSYSGQIYNKPIGTWKGDKCLK